FPSCRPHALRSGLIRTAPSSRSGRPQSLISRRGTRRKSFTMWWPGRHSCRNCATAFAVSDSARMGGTYWLRIPPRFTSFRRSRCRPFFRLMLRTPPKPNFRPTPGRWCSTTGTCVWKNGTSPRINGSKRTNSCFNPGCLMTALSPDGQNLACYSSNGLLTLVEVRTGNEILRTKGYSEEYSTMEFLGRLEPLPFFRENSFLSLTFSPDARYFVGLGSETLGYDLTERHPVSIKGSLGSAKRIVFLNADRALVSKDLFSPNAEIVSFPSGRLLSKTEAPVARWSAATRGDYIIWHPHSGARVAVFSLSNGIN